MDRYAYLHMPTPETIVFADQVVYRITGYKEGVFDLELVDDWRPAADNEPRCAVCLTPVSQHEGRICARPADVPAEETPVTEEQAEDLKAKWKQAVVHPVTALNQEEQP